jgi:4,5-DOPA dioxygenase extradiol
MTMPAAFFGHGSPMNTLVSNEYTEAWRRYGTTLEKPRAILVISAHWYVPGVRLTAHATPRTIHDFNSRFPKELFDFRYPAPVARDLIPRVQALLSPAPVERDPTWGIDHGAFSVLTHVFPDADVPVLTLSVDRRKSAREHYALARRLAPLRDEGVFIVGSGNVVHNIELIRSTERAAPYDWAERFASRMYARVVEREHAAIVDYSIDGEDARLSVPTPDHFLPFLYVLAQQRDDDVTTIIADGVKAGALGMLSLGFASRA